MDSAAVLTAAALARAALALATDWPHALATRNELATPLSALIRRPSPLSHLVHPRLRC